MPAVRNALRVEIESLTESSPLCISILSSSSLLANKIKKYVYEQVERVTGRIVAGAPVAGSLYKRATSRQQNSTLSLQGVQARAVKAVARPGLNIQTLMVSVL